MQTRDRILRAARIAFNEKGLHNVSIRELSRELEMSPGNFAYHFNTKGDLLAALLKELHQKNNLVVQSIPKKATLKWLYESIERVFTYDYEYRGILANYTDAVLSHPEMREIEPILYQKRTMMTLSTLNLLVHSKVLRKEIVDDSEQVIWSLMFTGRYWTSDARLRCPGDPPSKIIERYTLRMLHLLVGYLTPRARRDFDELIARGALPRPTME